MSYKDTLKLLQKDMGEIFEMDTTLEGISTGSIAVDLLTGVGGFPRRRISEVFGWESSGKTTLCLMACAKAQRDGLLVAYIDVERGVDLTYAAKLGFDYQDTSKGLYITPRSFEQTATVVNELVNCGDMDLIVVDSVPAMLPESQMEGDINEEGPIAARARKLASFLPKITKPVDANNVALVFVNQMRLRPAINKFDHGPKEQTSGGSALRFYSSLRLDLDQVRRGSITKSKPNPFTGKEEEVPVASIHRAEAFKNKVALPYRKLDFIIRYDEEAGIYGIDNLQTIIDLATVQGFIEAKGGGYFSYAGSTDDPEANFRCQGKDALYMHMVRNPKTVAALSKALGL